MQITVDFPPKLEEVFTGPARYRIAYGGRGSGKSVGFARMALLKAMDKPIRVLCARELQNSIKDSVHNLLVSEIDAMGIGMAYECGESFIRCKNGSEFIFKGLRTNTAEIKSMNNIGLCWIEEAQSISDKSLQLLEPTIRGEDSEIWMTFNPDDEDDPVYKNFIINQPDNAKVVKINWSDNPWFPSVLEDLRRRTQEKNPAKYEWIWEGNFNINTDGSVYGKWVHEAEKENRVRPDLFDPALPVHTAWDIGYSDYTTIWFFQAIRGELRCIDYYENNRHGLQHYCEQLSGYSYVIDKTLPDGRSTWKRGEPLEDGEQRKRYRYANHWVPHDAAHKLFASGGRSIVEQAYDFGFPMKVMPALPQQSQIQIARKSLESTWFDSVLCREGVKMLRKYQFEYDDDKKRYHDKPLHDHTSHAADAYELLAQVWKSPIMDGNKKEPVFDLGQTSQDIFWPPKRRGR